MTTQLSTEHMLRIATHVTALLLWFGALPVRAETVFMRADRDTTLIEDPDGALSNGAGPAFFVGQTNQPTGSLRRGLVRFDVASALPQGAIVESVKLHLTALPGNPGSSPVRLSRVLADWGEGASFSTGGLGARSEPDDATWIHTFYDNEFWKRTGGQFVGAASAAFVVDGSGDYLVTSSPKMLADVRLWKAAPSRNFGWILIGDESRPQSVRPFASRESPDPAAVPILEIVYRLPAGRS
jgi:hypothetical protein